MKTTLLLLTTVMAALHASAQDLSYTETVKVIAVDSAKHTITVDMVGTESDYLKELAITPGTTITRKGGQVAGVADLRPGTDIEATWTEAGYTNTAQELRITRSWTKELIDVEGVLQYFDAATGMAMVDGERVLLDPGVAIEGGRKMKGSWGSLSEISLGNALELEGMRGEDGYFHAVQAQVNSNRVEHIAGYGAFWKTYQAQVVLAHLTRNPYAYGQLATNLAWANGYVGFGPAQYHLVGDADVQQYVNNVGQSLVPAYVHGIPAGHPDHLGFQFMVYDDPSFSTFSLPDGSVFVSNGLLAQIDNEAQLAALLANEVAHVINRDAKERYENQQDLRKAIIAAFSLWWVKEGNSPFKLRINDATMDIATLLLYQGAQGDWGAVAKQALAMLPLIDKLPERSREALLGTLNGIRGVGSPQHSMADQLQGDRNGLFYMRQAGYDVREAATVWGKFAGVNTTTALKATRPLVEEWLQDPRRFGGENLLGTVGDLLLKGVIEAAMSSDLNAPLRAQRRYRAINGLIAAYYQDAATSTAKVNTEGFEAIRQKATASAN